MVVCDMDNGGSLIDVIDESELFEADPTHSDFSWADDFISSSEDGIGGSGGNELVQGGGHASIGGGQLAQPSVIVQQSPQVVGSSEATHGGIQVVQANHGLLQPKDIHHTTSTQQILSSFGNVAQGPGNQLIQGTNGQLILKTASGQQIVLQTQNTQLQQIQQTPPQSQQIQGTSFVSRSHTPSHSPAPITSPQIGHVITPSSRSMTPNQTSTNIPPVTMVATAKPPVIGNITAPNVNVLQLPGGSQSQVLTRNIPLQQVIQMSNPNANTAFSLQGQPALIQGQGNQILQQAHGTLVQQAQGQATLVPGQGQNIVNTQNTVIQNPNVVNVNVAHVLCNNQLQNQQGSTVHHMANIQGTLIQTPDGKYIITQNPQLAQGQSVNFQNIPQVTLQPQLNVAGQTANQNSASLGQGSGAITQGSVSNSTSNIGAVGNLGNVLRIAAQPTNLEKGSAPTNATHFIGVNQQGQQVLIQRAPTPTGQQQNVILRTLNPSNFLQIQQPAGSGNVNATTQAGQVTQPLMMTSQQQQVPLQKVITGPHGQQMKLVGPGNLQTAAPVTLNLAGQNLNLQNLQGSNALQTIQIVQQQQQQQLQQIQLQQQQVQKQVTSSAGYSSSEFSTSDNRTVSPSPNLTQNVSATVSSQVYSTNQTSIIVGSSPHNTQQASQQNVFTVPSTSARISASPHSSQIQQVRFSAGGTVHQQVDSHVHGSPQQLATSLQNVQIPLNHVNFSSLTTASTTAVTTTISQARIQMAQVSVASSQQVAQSVHSTPVVTTQSKPPVLQARINAPKLNQVVDVQKLQQIQAEIKKYSTIKNLTSEQKRHYMTLIEAHKRIVAQGQLHSNKPSGQVLIPSTQASVVQAASKLLPDGQQQQVLIQQAGQQIGVVDNHGQSSGSGIQFHLQQKPLQTQSGGGAQIPAGNNLVSQSALSSSTIVPNITSSVSKISSINPSIPVAVQSFHPQASQQQASIQSSNVVPSQVQTQSLSIPVQSSSITGSNQSTPAAAQSSTTTSSVLQMPVPTTVVQYSVPPPGKVAIPASPQVAVSTQIKIGNHILTLNLTPQQKEKVQSYLSKMTPEQQQAQISLFLRLQSQQQLQNQIKAQVQGQQQQQTQKLLTTPSVSGAQTKIPTTVQVLQSPDKAVPTSVPTLDNHQTVIIATPGQKLTRLSVAAIPKSQLIQQQLSKDQANALNPDVKSSFKSRRDTYRRLLRYHVYQSKNIPESVMHKDEEMFEEVSSGLLKKKDWMLNRFHMLLLQESMREKPTSEMVMLQRLINEDLKETIKEEKRLVQEDPESFEPMPLSLLEKKESFMDNKQTILKLGDNENNSAEQIQQTIKLEKSESETCGEVEIKSEILDEKPATPKLRLLIKNDGENFTSSIAPDSDEIDDVNHDIGVSMDTNEDHSKSQRECNQNSYSNVFSDSVQVKQEPEEVEDNSDKWNSLHDTKPFHRYISADDSQMACDSDMFPSSAVQQTVSGDIGVDSIPVNSSHGSFVPSANSLSSSNGAHNSPSHNSSIDSPSNNLSNISDDSVHDDTDDISESLQAVRSLNPSDSDQNFFLDSCHSSIINNTAYSQDLVYDSHPISNNIEKSSFNNQNNLTEHIDISDSSQESENQTFDLDIATSLSNSVSVQSAAAMLTNASQQSVGQYEPISSPEAERDESFSGFKVDSSYSVNIGDQKLTYQDPVSINSRRKVETDYSQHENVSSQEDVVMVGDTSWEEESNGEPDPQNELMQSAINSILSLNQESSSRPSSSYHFEQSSRFTESYLNQTENDSFNDLTVKSEDVSEEVPMEDDLDAAVNSILF